MSSLAGNELERGDGRGDLLEGRGDFPLLSFRAAGSKRHLPTAGGLESSPPGDEGRGERLGERGMGLNALKAEGRGDD